MSALFPGRELHERSVPRARQSRLGTPLFALLGAVCALAGCRVSTPAPGKTGPGASADCKAWSTRQDGPYRYENNQWGHEKAKGRFEQCLLERTVDGKTQMGWTWSWPGFDASVFAYPQILFGWKPWSGGRPTDARLPIRVADAKHLTLSYAVETQATGSFNLAPEIWLIKSGAWTTEPNPKLITSEVMFWMDYKEGARPAGRIIDTPTFDGVTYELWKADTIGDRGDGTGWALYSFKSPKVQHEGTISIHALLAHLVRGKHISPDEYVASVEFGNEVMGGTGTTWVRRFEVNVGN